MGSDETKMTFVRLQKPLEHTHQSPPDHGEGGEHFLHAEQSARAEPKLAKEKVSDSPKERRIRSSTRPPSDAEEIGHMLLLGMFTSIFDTSPFPTALVLIHGNMWRAALGG